MPDLTVKRGDTWPPLRGLAAENDLTITASDLTADTITVPGHGYANGDKVVFSTLTGGAPLVAGNLYFVVNTALNTFKVSLTSGGAAIDLTSDITVGKVKRLLSLATATGPIKVNLKSAATLITGTVTVIEPPIEEGGQLFNWKYIWAAADTATVGDYEAELEITWDGATTPPKKESVPNGTGPLVHIVADLG